MTYDELVIRLAHQTNLHSDLVRKVLYRLPDVLMELPVGDDVRTPLGVFRMAERKERPIILPDGETPAVVSRRVTVKLRAGARLQVQD